MTKVTVYGKNNLSYNNIMLKNLYLQGVERVKLSGGKWYDVQYSQAQRAYYVSVSRIQSEIK